MRKELVDEITKFSKIYLGDININLKDWFINIVPLILDEMINEENAMSFDYSNKYDKNYDGETKSQFNQHLQSISFNLKEANPSTYTYGTTFLEKSKGAFKKYVLEHKPLKDFIGMQDKKTEYEKSRVYREKHLEIALMEFINFFNYLVNDFEF